MNILSKIKSLVLGAAILPTILWAKPGDPLRFTSTRNREMNFDAVSLHVAADAKPKPVFEYRTGYLDNENIVWKDWQEWNTGSSIPVQYGTMVEVRAATDSAQRIGGFEATSPTWGTANVYSTFSFDGPFNASGDVTTLLCRGGTDTVGAGDFAYLFSKCAGLKSAPELPAVNLSTFCYAWMFDGTAIETPPALPAECLADRCYLGMFANCANLKSAPVLSATELADWCYQSMFAGCSSLEAAPELPATSLTDQCYRYMFKGCAALTAAPDLPATTLATNCYEEMFMKCSQLAAAPSVLPATNLVDCCYQRMFSLCPSLTVAPALPAMTMKLSCYAGMFGGCESLAAAPELPSKDLASYCYESMFQGCTALAHAPALPADWVVLGCYAGMFSGCTSLTEAPQLPAENLSLFGEGCYANMFKGCCSLTNVTLKARWQTLYCFSNWLDGVAPHGTIHCLKALELPADSASGVPSGWTREDIALPSPISGVEESYSFVAGAAIEPIVPTVAEGWSVKVTGLPAGLKAALGTGVVTGTPTKADTSQVTFTATKSGEEDAIVTTEITVRTVALTVAVAGTGTGKVTGAGDYAAGKKVTLKATADTKDAAATVKSVFAGWYLDAKCETAADFGVDWRTPSVNYTATDEDVTVYAKFIAQTDDVAAVSFALPSELTNGEVAEDVPVDVSGCTSLPTVRVSGLPAGLKFDAKKNAITGKPTKSGIYTVTVTVTTAGKATDSMSQTVVVRKTDEFVLDVSFDAAMGKATGAGVYAKDKNVTLKATANAAKKATAKTPEQIATVFAGWYTDADFTVPLEGAADFRTPSFAYAMPDAHTNVYAKFIALTDDVAAVSFELPAEMTTGVTAVGAPVDVSGCASLPTVKVAGLPTGLKFTAKDIFRKGSKTEVEVSANTIYGTPTKSGVYDVVVTVTTAGKKTASASRTVVVRKDGEKVVLAAVPEVGGAVPGKVTGPGVYAKGKDVTLKATANKGYVFAGWWEGGALKSPDASYKFKMGEVDVAFTAKFVTLAEEAAALRASLGDEPLSTAAPLEIYASCGVDLSWSLAANGITANAIAVSGLPTGLKFTAKDIVDAKTKKVTVPANTIYGVPTKASAVTKDWRVVPFAVKVTVTTAGKQKVVYPVNVTTYELPDYAVGTYNGALYDADTNLAGTATLTVTAKGAASGKLVDADGVTWTVKAASYASTDETLSTFCADLAATAKVGGKSVERVFRAAVTYTDCGGRVEASEDGGAFLVACQDLWKGAYKDDGAKLFRTGKNKYRVFEGGDVEAEGLEEGQSLMLKVEPSGKVTATLKGGAYVPTASATLVPLTRAGLPTMDAEATFVFLPKAAKNFSGQAVKATIKGIEDPAGPPAPVTRSWAGGTYVGAAMPMVGGVSQSYILSMNVQDGVLSGSFSNASETVAIPDCPLVFRKYGDTSGGKVYEVEEFCGAITSLTLGGETFSNVKVTVQPNYSAEGFGMALLSTDDWSLSVFVYQNPWSAAEATVPTFPAEGVSVVSSGDTYLFRDGGLVTVTFPDGGTVEAQAALEMSADGVFTVLVDYWRDYGAFVLVDTKSFTMPASGALESGDIKQ